MAKKPEGALLTKPVEVKVIHVTVALPVELADWPREKIDIVPEFVDFKLARLESPDMIDQLAVVKREIKDLQKWEKLSVDVLKGRMGAVGYKEEKVLDGHKFRAVLTGVGRRALSQEKLIAKFGEEALEDCYIEAEDNVVPTLKIGA